ncbi:hypothetical protein [Segnochrobactrum spirostomi]|uniref:Uncharacterized protein n=1 Tax=Segnochrobactrum spirostomi TaxID=2608987 RepID=A0A6A7Y8S1_9HYPH|nr:hypothetical protein [Segnochrobactrum spirostomi]MQT15125.1 hypothetical protein [Segnochrobactrum spirostomi]
MSPERIDTSNQGRTTMTAIQTRVLDVTFVDPRPPVEFAVVAGEAKESFSISASGMGRLTGLSYTVSAHTSGSIKAKLQIAALTSEDVKNLNTLALGMLDASRRKEVEEMQKTTASASANLSLWSYFFGGGHASASYESTRKSMESMGLSSEQISKLMDAFLEFAKQMSTVEIDFFVNNTNSDYSVSGDLYLYTLSGSISTQKGTQQYRMLADQASAGGPPPSGGGAPSTGQIIQL